MCLVSFGFLNTAKYGSECRPQENEPSMPTVVEDSADIQAAGKGQQRNASSCASQRNSSDPRFPDTEVTSRVLDVEVRETFRVHGIHVDYPNRVRAAPKIPDNSIHHITAEWIVHEDHQISVSEQNTPRVSLDNFSTDGKPLKIISR
jgi:hypothetical protein